MRHTYHAVPSTGDDRTLFALLAAAARQEPDHRLVACCVYGLSVVGEVALLHPAWWLVAALAVCVAAFGTWGLAERAATLTRSRASAYGVRAVQAMATAVGTLAGLTAIFGATALAIGSWRF